MTYPSAFGANFRVKSGHALVVEDDVVAIVAADADGAPARWISCFDVVAPENDELRHGYLLRIPVGLGEAGVDGRPSRANAPEIAESIRSAMRLTHVAVHPA